MGIFINITCDQRRIDPDMAHQLVATCPVDIFAINADQTGERLTIKPDQVDECTLCELCLKLVPAGALVIHKRYKDQRLGAV